MAGNFTTLTTSQALSQLVALMPLRGRLTAKHAITRLQQALKLPQEDICGDRRVLRRNPDNPVRLAFQHTIRMRQVYLVTWRDGCGPEPCTAEEAAAIVRRTVGSLRVLISHGKGTYYTQIDERLVSISRNPTRPFPLRHDTDTAQTTTQKGRSY